MAVFFTSDTHFGHAGARALYRRPFASVPAMDAAMQARWNAVVGPADEVWHLGDFAIGPGPATMATLLEGLHGRKHLVTGNNDGPATTGLPGCQRSRSTGCGSPTWRATVERTGALTICE